MTHNPWKASILTLFPEMFPGLLAHALSGKAYQKGLWTYETINIRDFTTDAHKTVDDAPYGGGAGMVMKPDIIHQAVESLIKTSPIKPRLIYLTPRGKPLQQLDVLTLSQAPHIAVLCGRYEGVDQRVIDYWQFEEYSIGDYVLSGGEVACLTLMDACIRLIPDVMGKEESWQKDSFAVGLLEHSHYTRPDVWQGLVVPEVLRSGDHQKIADWRQKNAEEETRNRRPDLWDKYCSAKGLTNRGSS